MIDKEKFPQLHPFIKMEQLQPLFSHFSLSYNETNYLFSVNEIAAEVMRLCNGMQTVSAIHSILSKKYSESMDEIEKKLLPFWETAQTMGHIVFLDKPLQRSHTVPQCGSSEYWTPEMLTVELTHKCPLQCKHCFLAAGSGENMSLKTWDSIMSSIQIAQIPQIQLTGGEPLLHPHFFDILETLLCEDITIYIFTSGIIYSRQIIEKFQTYDTNRIKFQISLDGLEQYHDSFRGVKGSFRNAVNFLSELSKIGYRTDVGVSVLTQPYDELKDLCELCKSIGVSVVRIGAISNRGRAALNGLGSDSKKIVSTYELKTRLANEMNCETFKVVANEESNSESKKYLLNCGFGQLCLKIAPNGDVFACTMDNKPFANINISTLLDMQKQYSRIFEKIAAPNNVLCAECEHRDICSNCIAEGLSHCKTTCPWWERNRDILQEIYKDRQY